MKKIFLLTLLSSLAYAAPTINNVGFQNPTVPGTVIFIAGTGLTGTTTVQLGSATDGTFTVSGDTQINYTIPVDAVPGGTLTISTPAGSVSGPTPITIVPYTPTPAPLCLPAVSNLHSLVNPSTGNTIVTVWCDVPSGTYHYGVSGNATNWMDAQCLTKIEPFNLSVSWVQHAWNACLDRAMSTSDQAYANRLFYLWVPRPTVLGSGPRTVFTLNADGTIGPQSMVSGVAQTVTGGIITSGLRVPGGAAKRFCDVSGMTSDEGAVLPAKSYATCKLLYAPATGWQVATSADKSFLQAPTDGAISDTGHHLWGIDSKGIITVDGVEDATTGNVVKLALVSSLIWQENSAGLWWSKSSPSAAWLPATGTATAPL